MQGSKELAEVSFTRPLELVGTQGGETASRYHLIVTAPYFSISPTDHSISLDFDISDRSFRPNC
jgi:hypothetical protein